MVSIATIWNKGNFILTYIIHQIIKSSLQYHVAKPKENLKINYDKMLLATNFGTFQALARVALNRPGPQVVNVAVCMSQFYFFILPKNTIVIYLSLPKSTQKMPIKIIRSHQSGNLVLVLQNVNKS